MDRKIVNIQAVRALAALMVLASHLYAFEASVTLAPVLPAAFTYGFAGVDLFFVVSGFVMVLVTQGRFGSRRQAGAFLFSRAWRIYPTYWLFTVLALLGVLALGEGAARLAQSPLLPSLTLWPMSPALPLLPIGWTLTHEIYFYLVFALFLLAPAGALPVLLGAWAVLVPLALWLGIADAGAVARLVFSPLTLEFILGAAAGLLVISGRRCFGWAALGAGIAGLVLGSLWLGAPTPDSFDQVWRRAGAYGLPCALVVYGAACIEIDGNWRAPGFLVALGDWSYSLYLLHFIVLAAVYRLWADAFAGPWDNIAVALLSFFLCVRLARLSFRVFERPTLRLGARMRARLLPRRDGEPGPDEPRMASRLW